MGKLSRQERVTREELRKIIEKNGWALRVQWMPECTDDIDDDHLDCPVYKWNEDEDRAIDALTDALLSKLPAQDGGEK